MSRRRWPMLRGWAMKPATRSRQTCRWISSSRPTCRADVTGKIVITRPRDEAVGLAAELTARGYDTLVEPMLEIVPLPAAIPDLRGYHALIFTSANGVSSFAGRSADRSLPAYAVGVRTADNRRAAGFTDVRGASGDVGLLAGFVSETLGNA